MNYRKDICEFSSEDYTTENRSGSTGLATTMGEHVNARSGTDEVLDRMVG